MSSNFYWCSESHYVFTEYLRSRVGWAKTIGNMRQVMVRGLQKVDQMFVLTMAAYNLTHMRTLGQLRPEAAQ